MLTADSLPVASPSTVRLEPGPGEAITARKGRPDAAAHSAPRAGSNSTEDGYGDCRHCPSSWPLTPEGKIPQHGDRRVLPGHGTRPVCQGTNEAPATRIEPAKPRPVADEADGSDLLEA